MSALHEMNAAEQDVASAVGLLHGSGADNSRKLFDEYVQTVQQVVRQGPGGVALVITSGVADDSMVEGGDLSGDVVDACYRGLQDLVEGRALVLKLAVNGPDTACEGVAGLADSKAQRLALGID